MVKPITRYVAIGVGSFVLTLLVADFLAADPGDTDCTFGAGGVAAIGFSTSESTFDIALQSDGGIVGAGSKEGSIQVARWLVNGNPDPGFGIGGLITVNLGVDVIAAVAIDDQDRIIVVGTRTEATDVQAFVARFTADGALDPSFATAGSTSFGFAGPGAQDRAFAVAIDSLNQVLVAGATDPDGTIPGQSDIALVRFTESGTLDPTFGTGGRVVTNSGGTRDDDSRALRLTATAITVIGTTQAIGGSRDTIVLRYSATDGSLDASFDGDGIRILDLNGLGDDRGQDLVVDASERIVGVSFGPSDSLTAFRLTTAGALDTNFGTAGSLVIPFAQGAAGVPASIELQADGKILISGSTASGIALLRLTTSGTLDPTFGQGGQVTPSHAGVIRAYGLAIQPDGRLLVGGTQSVSGGTILLPIAWRFLNDGHANTLTSTIIDLDSPDPSANGQTVTVQYTVSSPAGTPTGDVLVTDGIESCQGSVADGACSLALSTLGARTLRASYQGDGTFCPSSRPEPHTVVLGTTTTITADSPDPSLVGQAVQITFEVTSTQGTPDGMVSVDDGQGAMCTAELADGVGSCTLASTISGSRDWTASYAGNSSYLGSTAVTAHQVLDTQAPVVDLVDARPNTGDSMLAPCESVRVRIEALDLVFSEALRTGGGVDAADNPSNYLLLGAGDDLSLTTVACGLPAGDDVVHALASVIYQPAVPEEPRSTASLTLDRRLEDGAYRLIACSAIADVAGNALDGDGDGNDGDDFVLDFRVATANLLANGHFDCDLADWLALPAATPQITHSEVDGDDAAQSGSGLLVNSGGLVLALGQCAMPTAGLRGNYQLSARLRVDALPGVAAGIVRSCELFDNAACSGTPFATELANDLLLDTTAAFVERSHTFDAPPGTLSVFCDVASGSAGANAWDLYIDQVILQRTPIFSDGFESGNISAWTGTLP